MTNADAAIPIPPLTRNGYERLPDTQAQIIALSIVGDASLIEAFGHPEGTADYRKPEALVFFIRRAHRSGKRRLRDALFALLVRRCQVQFRGWIRAFDSDARKDIQSEVLADMAGLLVDPSDRGDFLETRFWSYLRRRTITAISEAQERRRRAPFADDHLGSGGEVADEIALRQDDALLAEEEREKVRQSLLILPDQLRELVILRYFENWQIGNERSASDAAGVPTLAERFGCTPRTIHNRLVEARSLLAAHWKEER